MRKTKKAVRRRIRVTKSGGVKRSRPGRRHLLGGKTRARKRHLRKQLMLDQVDVKRIRRLLPHG